MSNLSSAFKTPICSSNRKSIFLREWWLIEVERDSKLGVGGFVNRETLESRGMRILGSASVSKWYNVNTLETGIQVFCSAAIAKRLDNNILEAVDGITITISGSINRSRTLSYGISPEVCDRFLSGFPCNWEEYAAKSSRDNHANTTERSLPVSFDDLPVTRVRDILMSSTGESEACALTSIIFRDILKQCGGDCLDQSALSVYSDKNISWNSAKTELDHKQHAVSLSNPTQKVIKEAHKIHSFPVDLHEEILENSKETVDDDKQEDDGFMSNATHKITKDAQAKTHIQVQADAHISFRAAANLAGTSPKSSTDPFSNLVVADPKPSSRRIHAEECKTTTMSGNKRIATRSQRRYSLRSTQIKKIA